MLIKVLKCETLDDSRLSVAFNDGSRGVVDLAPLLARDGEMVKPLRDPTYFARVFLEAGAPTWPNGFDLAPWALHQDLNAAGRLEILSQQA